MLKMLITEPIIINGKFSIAISKWWENDNSNTAQSTSQRLASATLVIDFSLKNKILTDQ